MRRRPKAFSQASTGDLDIPSSCEMKDRPAFKPLQGNPAFFQVRASRGRFHLRQETQGSSHIPIFEGKLLLRCLWQFGLPLESKIGNQLSSRDDMGCTVISSSSCTEIDVPLDLRWLSEGTSEFPKASQATSCVWCGTRDGYGANSGEMGFISSWFGAHRAIWCSWGYISALLVLWQCSWELSGVPSSKLWLRIWLIGNTGVLCMQCRGIRSHLASWGKSHGFLELWQEPGVYSRVTAGMAIRNLSLFSKVTTPV